MGFNERKRQAQKENDIRRAAHQLGESSKGNVEERWNDLVSKTGSRAKAEKAYNEYVGNKGPLKKFLGR